MSTPIQLFYILDGNDCGGDRVCEACMDEMIHDCELQPGERVVESGKGLCCYCGEGEWEE
jgi:hypothetical protein